MIRLGTLRPAPPAQPARDGVTVMGPTWLNRFWGRLGYYGGFDETTFDWRLDVPAGGDLLTCITTVTVSWPDRWRLLLSGRCEVETWTKTPVPVGKTETRSSFRTLPPA